MIIGGKEVRTDDKHPLSPPHDHQKVIGHYSRGNASHVKQAIDAALAAMSFMFAAEILGLGTCCINWPDIEEDELRAEKLLGLNPDQRPIVFMAVGFPDPDGGIPYSQKKPIEKLLKYNWE